jgi:hypothetical protein
MTGSLTGLPTAGTPALMSETPPFNDPPLEAHPLSLPASHIVARSAAASRPTGRSAVALRASPDPDASPACSQGR